MTAMNAVERREILKQVCDALKERNYDPVRQLRGYLLSEDPTYIPDHKGARTLIAEIDREALLDDLLLSYLSTMCNDEKAVSD